MSNGWYGATKEWYKPGMYPVDQLKFDQAAIYKDLYDANHETYGLVWVWSFRTYIRFPSDERPASRAGRNDERK